MFIFVRIIEIETNAWKNRSIFDFFFDTLFFLKIFDDFRWEIWSLHPIPRCWTFGNQFHPIRETQAWCYGKGLIDIDRVPSIPEIARNSGNWVETKLVGISGIPRSFIGFRNSGNCLQVRNWFEFQKLTVLGYSRVNVLYCITIQFLQLDGTDSAILNITT
jgi:hypothetical protein